MSKFTQGRFALSLHLNLYGDEARPLRLPRVSPTQVHGKDLKTLSSWAPSYSAVPAAPWALTNYVPSRREWSPLVPSRAWRQAEKRRSTEA